jgi:MFS family permease
MPKRRLLLLTQTGAMLLAFILAALTFSGIVQAWHIVVLAAGLGLVNAFDAPARQAFVVDMVGSRDLPNAIALNSLMFNSARAIGPAWAVAAGGRWRGWCFTINGISFLAVLLSLAAMQLDDRPGADTAETPWRQLWQGVQYLRGEPTLSGIIWLSLAFSVFGVSYYTLMPAFVERVLQRGPEVYGWVTAATGVGAVVGPFSRPQRADAARKVPDAGQHWISPGPGSVQLYLVCAGQPRAGIRPWLWIHVAIHDDEYPAANARGEPAERARHVAVRAHVLRFCAFREPRRGSPLRANRAELCHQRFCCHQSDPCDRHTSEGT